MSLLLALAFPRPSGAVDAGVVSDLTWGTSAAEQDRTAVALKDLGARWVRVEINWSEAEPAPGSYHAWSFEQYDRAVELARGAGAKVVIMVGKSPRWASGSPDPGTPPKDPADYTRFLRHVVDRYSGSGISAYEIWNEQNIRRFWSTGPDPSGYVALLKAAYGVVKDRDPGAKVVFGGLSTNDLSFVEGAYAAGAKGYFDVMAVHPYTCATSPDLIARDASGRIQPSSFAGYREIRALMLARGDAKPIWFTEFGWSTTSQACGVDEATQADFLTKAFEVAARDSYVEVGLWYNLRNNYWQHDADEYEARFGLMQTDFSRKPAYAAFQRFAGGALNPPPEAPAPLPSPPVAPLDPPAAAPPPPVSPVVPTPAPSTPRRARKKRPATRKGRSPRRSTLVAPRGRAKPGILVRHERGGDR